MIKIIAVHFKDEKIHQNIVKVKWLDSKTNETHIIPVSTVKDDRLTDNLLYLPTF